MSRSPTATFSGINPRSRTGSSTRAHSPEPLSTGDGHLTTQGGGETPGGGHLTTQGGGATPGDGHLTTRLHLTEDSGLDNQSSGADYFIAVYPHLNDAEPLQLWPLRKRRGRSHQLTDER